MKSYVSYNLFIKSDIELSVYPEATSSELESCLPNIEIRKANIDRNELSKYNNNGDYLAGTADDTLLFHVKKGNTILFDPLPEADRRFIQAVVGGELMAALLRQRGILPLHASCVSAQGQSIAFVGDSGWGKSTLATFFAKEGYSLVADDILALDLHSKHPTVHPSPPYVRLQPDVGNKFISGYEKLPISHNRTSKRHIIFENVSPQTKTRLTKIYFLENVEREKNSVETISPNLATVKLINHTRAKRLTTDPNYTKEHLKKCSSLVNKVDLGLLKRSTSLGQISNIKNTIEKDLFSCPKK